MTLAVHPHRGGLAEVRDAAARLNAPLRLVEADRSRRPATTLRASEPVAPVVRVTSETGGVEVDAVKCADDGSGDLIVRLHEACGNRVAVGGAGQPSNRRGLVLQPVGGAESTARRSATGSSPFTLRPFQLVTLRLRLAPDHFDGRSLT